jgi:hypothetical protein
MPTKVGIYAFCLFEDVDGGPAPAMTVEAAPGACFAGMTVSRSLGLRAPFNN